MKFACDGCGKKYVLTDAKIAGKRNVRLRCRACDHVVIIKRDGELVISPIVGPSVRPPPSLAPDLMPSEFPSTQVVVEATTGAGDTDTTELTSRDTSGDTSDGLAERRDSTPIENDAVSHEQPNARASGFPAARVTPGGVRTAAEVPVSSSPIGRKLPPWGLTLTVVAILVIAIALMSNC